MKRKHLFCRFEQMQVHPKIKINTAFSILSQFILNVFVFVEISGRPKWTKSAFSNINK